MNEWFSVKKRFSAVFGKDDTIQIILSSFFCDTSHFKFYNLYCIAKIDENAHLWEHNIHQYGHDFCALNIHV